MHWIAIVGIALANNLDNTGVGIALGIARIRLAPLINLWIALLTFIITASAVAFGRHLASFLPLPLAHVLSAIILCGMGLWMLLPSLLAPERQPSCSALEGSVSLRRILSDPTSADRNRSQDIDVWEATLLAVALCLNNLGGGFSGGLVHLSALWIGLYSGLVSFLVLWLGGWAGHRLGATRMGKHTQVTAGILLVVLGLCQVL